MWPVVARNVHETVLILYWLSNHLHKKGWGVRRKLLAVRFIDRKQALCDKNLKLRASKFSILNHQIGSYKFTRFLIGCQHSTVYQCKYMYITPSRVEPHILYGSVRLCLCLHICLFYARALTLISPPCTLLRVSTRVRISPGLPFFPCLCERVQSFIRVWPCSQWPIAFSPDSREGGKWPTFSLSPY